MNERLAHERPVEVAQVLQERFGMLFLKTLATDGVALGIRPDWESVVADLRKPGTTRFRFAFHGYGDMHDMYVQRAGAYDELIEAVRRGR